MTKILVTGAKGQVGSELQKLAVSFPKFAFTFVDVDDLDITDSALVQHFFRENHFDYCINCAAYTAVDKAESDEEIAFSVNVEGPKNLAQAALLHQTQIIQLSTDYVYHTSQNTPLKETDLTNPQSVYARTKLEGDEIIQRILPTAMIIRTSWVYSTFGHNFVKTMLRLGKERESLSVVFDQIGTPTYAYDLAHAMLMIIEKITDQLVSTTQLAGIYHYSNEGVTSWYDFATAIFKLENINCQVSPIESVAYPTPAARPSFSVLNKNKIKTTFELNIPHWEVSLQSCLDALKAMEG